MFKNLRNFLGNNNNSAKITHKVSKIRTFSLSPKHWLKDFLYWLRLRDSSGALLIDQDTDINKIIAFWTKKLMYWLVGVFVTGFLITIALIPFYKVPFGIETIMIMFCFGLLYYVILEAIKDIRNAIKKGV